MSYNRDQNSAYSKFVNVTQDQLSVQYTDLPIMLWQNSGALFTFFSLGLSGMCTGFSGLAINLRGEDRCGNNMQTAAGK
jgi:hypothetical protein